VLLEPVPILLNNQSKQTTITQYLTPSTPIRSRFPKRPQKRPSLFHRHDSPCINLYEAFSSDNFSTSSNTSSSSRPLSSTADKTWKQVLLTHYFCITPPQPKAHPITLLDSSAKPPKILSLRQKLLRYGKPRKNNLPKITRISFLC